MKTIRYITTVLLEVVAEKDKLDSILNHCIEQQFRLIRCAQIYKQLCI